MADKYGVFRKRDCDRIKRVVHRVEGTPRQYLKVPQRVPMAQGSGSGAIDITGLLLGNWTLSEHEPLTGATIKTWYRGPSRQTTTAKDWDVMMMSDDTLLTIGETNIGRDNGVAVLYSDDADSSALWYADDSGIASPVATVSGSLPPQGRGIHEAGDGFYWVSGAASVGRLNPATGAFTHRLTTTSTPTLFPCPTSGSVIVSPVDTDTVKIIDATASVVATFTGVGASGRIDVSGNLVAIGHGGNFTITTRDATSLGAISTRTEAITWGIIGDIATDGTNVYAITQNGGLRAQLASNLATDVWNASAGGTNATTSIFISPINGYIYLVYGSTSWNVRKVDPATGSTVWTTASALFGSLGTNSGFSVGSRVAFGSDFVVVTSPATQGGSLDAAGSYNVVCLNDSDGSERWRDWDGTQSNNVSGFVAAIQTGGVWVSSDDRVFVAHDRKQQ